MRGVASLLWFALAGVAGFLVDSATLWALGPWLGLYVGRLASFTLAVLTTWAINRRLAFAGRESRLGLGQELARYFALMLLGGACNLLAYAWLVSESEYCRQLPVLAVAAGSLAGMLVNYLSTRLGVFRHTARGE